MPEANPLTTAGNCTICGVPSKLRCSKCKDARYCSPECQRTDWEVHKLLCASVKAFAIPPGPNMRRAILFKHDAQKPEFIWLKTESTSEEGESYDIGNVLDHPAGLTTIEVNPVRNKTLKNGIDVLYSDDVFGTSGPFLPKNDCLCKLILDSGVSKDWHAPKPRDETIYPWRGNILCCGVNGDPKDRDSTRDLDTTDFRDIFDALSVHSLETDDTPLEELYAARARKVKGVCLQHAAGQTQIYTSKMYPQDHPWTGYLVAGELSKVIGVDIRYFGRNVGHHKTPAPIDHSYAVLFPKLKPAPSDVHVFRYDGKEILPEHLEFLMYFALEHIHPAWRTIQPKEFIARGAIVLGELVERDNWNRIWDEFKIRKGLNDNFPDLRDM